MERNELLQAIKLRMPEKRYVHTLGVTQTAMEMATFYGEDPKRAEVAAILHDVCKYADVDWMEKVVKEQGLNQTLLGWGSELLHGPVGAYVAQTEFCVSDEGILDAIRYHTTGRASMSRLEKIIFVADMIEPNRKFEGVERLRDKAKKDLDKAVKACVRHSLSYLISSKQSIFPLSLECYNYLIKREEK